MGWEDGKLKINFTIHALLMLFLCYNVAGVPKKDQGGMKSNIFPFPFFSHSKIPQTVYEVI